MTPTQLAKLVHANIKAHADATSCIDIPSWADTTHEYKAMALAGIERFMVCPIDLTPEISHALWSVDAVKRGWIHGNVFDAAAKTNPRLIPFGHLSKESQYISDIVLSTHRHYKRLIVPDYNYSSCGVDAHKPTNVVAAAYVHEQHIYQGIR